MLCIHCQKLSSSKVGFKNHTRACKKNPDRTPTWLERNKPITSWNKGLSKESDSRVKAHAELVKLFRKNNPQFISESTRKKHSENAMKNEFGGHTSKKKLKYLCSNGTTVFLQSSYEIRLAEILDSLGIEWTRPKPLWWTDVEGKKHRYYPDFKIGNIFIDTKNDYLIKIDADKIARVRDQNKINLRVISESEINVSAVQNWVGIPLRTGP